MDELLRKIGRALLKATPKQRARLEFALDPAHAGVIDGLIDGTYRIVPATAVVPTSIDDAVKAAADGGKATRPMPRDQDGKIPPARTTVRPAHSLRVPGRPTPPSLVGTAAPTQLVRTDRYVGPPPPGEWKESGDRKPKK